MTPPLSDTAEDADRWWRAYRLAEDDRPGGNSANGPRPRMSTPGGSWLADRARIQEAIEVIRPLAETGDDVADLWLARWPGTPTASTSCASVLDGPPPSWLTAV